MPIGIRNNGGTLRCSIPHSVIEVHLIQEVFNLAIKCRAADYDFIELSTESRHELLADLIAYSLIDQGQLQQYFHTGCLQLGKNRLSYDLFDNQGDCNDQVGLHFSKGLKDDARTWNARKEINMDANQEFVEKFKAHAVHMCHRQHTNHFTATLKLIT